MIEFTEIKKLTFLEDSVIRVPKNNLNLFVKIDKHSLPKVIMDEWEGVFIASKEFADVLINWELGNKPDTDLRILQTIYKYYSRLSYKTTPFGLFAGIGKVSWGDKTNLYLQESTKSVKLDREFVYLGSRKIIDGIEFLKNSLKYHLNSTFYTENNWVKFFSPPEPDKESAIIKLEKGEELKLVIDSASSGATLWEINDVFTEMGADSSEVMLYLKDLVDVGFLVSEIDSIPKNKFQLQPLISKLTSFKASNELQERKLIPLIRKLEELQVELSNLNQNSVSIYDYKKVALDFNAISGYENRLKNDFTADLNFRMLDSTLNSNLRSKIRKSIWVLSKFVELQDVQIQSNLSAFKKRFKQKFKEKIVSISEAFDLDNGIIYKQSALKHNKLEFLDHANFKFLGKLLVRSLQSGAKSINLDKSDLMPLQSINKSLPKVFSVSYSLVDPTRDILYVKNICTNPIGLINRFSNDNKEMSDLVRHLANIDINNHPNDLVTDVIHLPRQGLLNIAEGISPYENYFEYATRLDGDIEGEKIELDDIMICVIEENIVLFHKRYQKQIIPRFNHMIHYDNFKLPICKFLLDLSANHFQTFSGFSWSVVGDILLEFDYLPRLQYEDIIISPATWVLRLKEFSTFSDFLVFRDYCKLKKFPRFGLIKHENEENILLNLELDISYTIITNIFKKQDRVSIEESLYPLETCSDNEIVSNEVVSFLYAEDNFSDSDSPTFEDNLKRFIQNGTLESQNSFLPGENWIYFKLYINEEDSNTFLDQIVNPLIEMLEDKMLINKWFFIRYSDPQHHIRLRIEPIDKKKITSVLKYCKKNLKANPYTYDISLGSYERESFRYGPGSIETAEQIFNIDSVTYLKFLAIAKADVANNQVLFSFVFMSVEKLLEGFGYNTVEEKLRVISKAAKSFQEEFNIKDPSIFRSGIYKEYFKIGYDFYFDKRRVPNKYENSIEEFLESKSYNLHPLIQELSGQSNNRGGSNRSIPLEQQTFGSYLHMMLNRIFVTNPRENELVVYSVLSIIYTKIVVQKS